MKNVLYIEDNQANVILMQKIALKIPDITLFCEKTAREGIAKYEALRPSLVLLDMNLPDGSGIDVARKIITASEATNPKIFIVSADAMLSEIETVVSSGYITGYITKPYDIKELIKLISDNV